MKTTAPLRVAVALTLSMGLGCGSDSPTSPVDAPPDAAPVDEPLEGGSLTTSCGTVIATPVGATAPGPAVEGDVGDRPTPRQVRLGVIGDPSTTVAMLWRTMDDRTKAGVVQYGVGDLLDQTASATTFAYETMGITRRVRIHEAHLCGLVPDTFYSYRVGVEGAWSPVYRFRTLPDPEATPDAEVVLALLGDVRIGHDKWGEMIAMVETQAAPDLILFSGDAVFIGTDQREWDSFLEAAGDVLARVPLVGAHGNHDQNAIAYYAQFALPGDEQFFSLRAGAAHLAVANDSPEQLSDLQGRAVDFLDADLTAATAPWTMVMHHRPLWSAAANHGGDEALQAAWGPVFDEHEVDLVLNGHDHNYERTKPMRGNTPQATPAEGTVYLVAGSAGAELYDNGTGFWTEVSEKTYNVVVLRVRPGQLDLTAYRDDGSMLDNLTITK